MNAVWSLFPKNYRDLDVRRLAALVRETGLDTTNVVVRKGYLVDEDTLGASLPLFVEAARKEGLEVRFASTTFAADDIAGPDSPLAVFSACGIREFRMGWFHKEEEDVRGAIQRAKADMDRVAEACRKHRVKAIYQVHHNTLITSASAAYSLVKGLPAAWIGVELDPGNQSFQGFEPWHYSVGLLGEYCAWVGVKDTVTWQEKTRKGDLDKGWRRNFAPLSEGVTNWRRLAEALVQSEFDGALVFMPFYDEKDEASRTKKLKAEVKYLRGIFSAVQSPNSLTESGQEQSDG
ncbi:MAG: TIM barrel protein [Fimbriimonas sp.]|nr:TIM barrel protein [Fimbriimonas sp.]